jgi:hypothetical protein
LFFFNVNWWAPKVVLKTNCLFVLIIKIYVKLLNTLNYLYNAHLQM